MTEATKPAAPAPVAEAPPTRRRRLWRWFKKWTRRAFLLVLVLLVAFSVWYPIHRALAYRAGDRAVAEMRAELDAADPGWRLDDIEAKYTASLPPPEKNSFRFIAQVPDAAFDLKHLDERQRSLLNIEFEEFRKSALTERVNRQPVPAVREFLRAARAAYPADHPAVVALAGAGPGGAPFVRAADSLADEWLPVERGGSTAGGLALAGQYAALVGDHAASVRYARAALGCGRALGDMPRTRAEWVRNVCAVRAADVTRYALSWGAPQVDLAPLQAELLAEAERDPLAHLLRGDRAALDRDEHPPNARDELRRRFNWIGWKRDPYPSERLFMFAARPYKESGRALCLRTGTELLDLCALPAHERKAAYWRLKNKTFEATRDGSNPFFHRWASEYSWSEWRYVDRACSTRAHLRAAAVALACERFRQARGSWPNALADLVPAYLPAVPADPWDGKPLRYSLRPEGALVYSVGADGEDDSGALEMANLIDQFDICFLLWDPELRGLPPEAPEPLVPELP